MEQKNNKSAAGAKPAANGFWRRLAAALKRARAVWLLLLAAALFAFVLFPLIINGSLVPASAALPYTPTAAPAPTPVPTPAPSESTPTPASDTPVPTPAPTATPEPRVFETLKREDKAEAVAELQARLMELDYLEYDEPTTFFGPATEAAVTLFQRVQGMEEDGIATPELQALLFSNETAPYCMKRGDNGSDVRGMQDRLAYYGYYEDKINGFFGLATQRAVVKFQKRNKLEQTGVIDLDARSLLYSPNARYLVDPTPTPTPKPTATPKPARTPRPNISATAAPISVVGSGAEAMIAVAQSQLGKPYVWSEESPERGFDCSGLVYYSLRSVGVSTGRYNAVSFSQVSSWQQISSLSECQRGDLLFFTSDGRTAVNHTGIYLGGGQFVHASSSAGRVVISTTTGYYQRNFVVARRVF